MRTDEERTHYGMSGIEKNFPYEDHITIYQSYLRINQKRIWTVEVFFFLSSLL